jgi:hypothetical protein
MKLKDSENYLWNNSDYFSKFVNIEHICTAQNFGFV